MRKLVQHLFLVSTLLALTCSSAPSSSATPPLARTRSLEERTPPIPSAQDVIERLHLAPHPEGGYFIETFRDENTVTNNRSASTAIFYLLEAANRSHWHRIDAVEVWHYYAGAPLRLSRAWDDGTGVRDLTLGAHVLEGQNPQGVVAKREWQSAKSLGKWTLVGCTVAPGFLPEGFELAPPDWKPR